MTDDASSEWRTLPPAARTVAMISGVLLALPAAVAIGFLASTAVSTCTSSRSTRRSPANPRPARWRR